MLKLLDLFFTTFHTVLIFFNLFGWIYKPTRKANLVTLLLTGCSWFILGIFYGIGYCPVTDWHFRVLEKLGYTNLPASYIEFLLHRLTGLTFPERMIDITTFLCFFTAFVFSLIFNIYDWRKKHMANI